MEWTDLTPIHPPIPWALVGAAAARMYMPERATLDMDIAIQAKDAAAARHKLSAAQFRYQSDLSTKHPAFLCGIGGSAWRMPDGKMLDMIEGHEPWWIDALNQAQTNRDTHRLPVLPLHYLVLIKFQAGRVQDIADVTRMLGLASEAALNEVRELFQQHAPTDVNDLESLIALGKLETGGINPA